jgi:predicted 2-oxoglutarate/Fe(II)-dependent dioxygenase YbiX
MAQAPLLAVAKMPDDVTKSLLRSFKRSKGEGNPNDDLEQDNDYRKVNVHSIRRDSVAYTFLNDMSILYRQKTGVDWDHVDLVQVMEYNAGDKYDDHTDWTLEDVGDENDEGFGFRKISYIAQLSEPDDYSGGNVNIWLDGKAFVVPKEKGTICAFPSFNLHGVEPVTGGTRLSMVSWVLGVSNWR